MCVPGIVFGLCMYLCVLMCVFCSVYGFCFVVLICVSCAVSGLCVYVSLCVYRSVCDLRVCVCGADAAGARVHGQHAGRPAAQTVLPLDCQVPSRASQCHATGGGALHQPAACRPQGQLAAPAGRRLLPTSWKETSSLQPST